MLDKVNFSEFNWEQMITNFASGLLILIVGWVLTNFIVKGVQKLLQKREFDQTLIPFIMNMLRWALRLVVISMAISTMGVAAASLTGIIAATTLAIGMALQGTLGHFASGIVLLMTRSIKVGDFVEVGGKQGVVREIKIFQTILETFQGNTIYVPNGNVIGNAITNVSEKPTRRIDVDFGISFGDDIKLARDIMFRALNQDERILTDPPPLVPVTELKDSAVNLQVRAWVKSEDYWNARFDLIEKIKTDLQSEGITIPFPQSEILFKGADIKPAQN